MLKVSDDTFVKRLLGVKVLMPTQSLPLFLAWPFHVGFAIVVC